MLPGEVPLGSVALSELESCGLEPLVVVVRADDPLSWLPPAREGSGRRTETCLTAHLGLSFSLRCGLNAVLPMQPDAIVVALADQPFVKAALVRELIGIFKAHPELDYVASRNDGTAMPPVLFGRSMFMALQGLDGDQGAAALLRSPDYKGRVLSPESALCFMDADTKEDFGKIQTEWLMRNGS
ncbi:molybdenum cofactor cytidylyltransferase [Paenibacillus sp. NFR01]|nr:molybdenum cofactor cytidylyltransferase [Paenibacillus sp. NFR01]